MMNITDIHEAMQQMCEQVRREERRSRSKLFGGPKTEARENSTLVSMCMERIFECKFTEDCNCAMCVDEPVRIEEVKQQNRLARNAEVLRKYLDEQAKD